MEPVRVCEILSNIEEYRGKPVAVVGLYSFREAGRYLSEAACEAPPSASTNPRSLRLTLDSKEAPKLPEPFDIDGLAADRKLKLIRKATSLGKFRFGSIEYDRWAIVYGRIEPAAAPSTPRASKLEPAPAQLVYRGDGLIFFVAGE